MYCYACTLDILIFVHIYTVYDNPPTAAWSQILGQLQFGEVAIGVVKGEILNHEREERCLSPFCYG